MDTQTTSTIKEEGGVLHVDATNDFAGGLVAAGASLRVSLNHMVAAGTMEPWRASAVYDYFVEHLEKVLGEGA